MIKPVGQIELVCETQGKFHTLQFQLLNKDVMGSQPPLLSGSDCVRLGLVEIRGNTCSLDRNNPKGVPQKCASLTRDLCEEEWRKVELLIRKSGPPH